MKNIEFETKVLDISVGEVSEQLVNEGYVQQPVQNFQRRVYELDGNENAWIRLRTNGEETTLTHKEYKADAIDGVEEIEIVVDSFERTHDLLEKLGYASKTYQENRRTNFVKEGSTLELSIDEWPKIPPYLEIEGDSKQAVEECLGALGLAGYETTSAPTSEVYKRYGLDLKTYDELTFS